MSKKNQKPEPGASDRPIPVPIDHAMAIKLGQGFEVASDGAHAIIESVMHQIHLQELEQVKVPYTCKASMQICSISLADVIIT